MNANAARVVVERCPKCRTSPDQKRPFLSLKDYDWESLPLFLDNTETAPPCAYRGCTNEGSEYHHYAPRHLFEDADQWPAGPLCHFHHDQWHKLTQTGSYTSRKEKK